MEEIKDIYLPKWASVVYALLGIALIPWIILLAEYLPTKHIAQHWDSLWVGFDIMILLAIILTVYYVITKKIWVIISASALGTLLIIDAWFDILTARPGSEQRQSIAMGVIEIFLSLITYRMVYLIIHQSGRHRSLQYRTRKAPK
jgi:hypothetical protein